jgi:hypothetical protein
LSVCSCLSRYSTILFSRSSYPSYIPIFSHVSYFSDYFLSFVTPPVLC